MGGFDWSRVQEQIWNQVILSLRGETGCGKWGAKQAKELKGIPQGLKPTVSWAACGTDKSVPFQNFVAPDKQPPETSRLKP